MGFDKAANPDVVGTLKAAVDKINALPVAPAFMLHTGDISHLSKPGEFDTVDQLLKAASTKDIFFVPGEHDVLNDDGKSYLERYGKGTQGSGWYSFDKNGVHFVGLVNVMNLKAGGLGSLGGRTTGMAGERREASFEEHAHRGLRPHSAVERLSGVGLGHRRQRAGAFVLEALRLGHGAERTHSPDHAEGGRQHHLPHRGLHRVSLSRNRARRRLPGR